MTNLIGQTTTFFGGYMSNLIGQTTTFFGGYITNLIGQATTFFGGYQYMTNFMGKRRLFFIYLCLPVLTNFMLACTCIYML
jgi:hypothetical protein